ncbi:hypothetical protein HYC85_026381 [Camellia sinensis]|uniref:Uncharacterized protein n=1 Tax=Camellia sinensis TaxID=4442 RepID=A0A7J7G3H0_CAMSI|nr:hypothetical protein HYC85_026381 [Camellia sinensis]
MFGLEMLPIEEGKGLRNDPELVRSVADKHFDLLRPSARYSLAKRQMLQTMRRQFSIRLCVPINVVLCCISLLWKLLSEGSKRASWPCCFCNYRNGMFSYIVDRSIGSFNVAALSNSLSSSHHCRSATIQQDELNRKRQ